MSSLSVSSAVAASYSSASAREVFSPAYGIQGRSVADAVLKSQSHQPGLRAGLDHQTPGGHVKSICKRRLHLDILKLQIKS